MFRFLLHSFLATSSVIAFSLGAQAQTWQETLEQQFDIVETFDQLQDWTGTKSNAVDVETYPDEFPIKIDGSPSIWQYYYSSAPSSAQKWIGDHGASNVWRGAGKSACIDYNEGADGVKYGPQRLAFKIGDSPDDGYDELFLFFMTKWNKAFFKRTGNSFDYHRFLKTLDISAGFKTVRHWGTATEYNWVQANGGPTQVLHEYGMNAQVYNYYSYNPGGDRIEVVMNTALTTSSNNTHYTDEVWIYRNLNLGSQILADQWFGIEYRVKKSSPAGTANGEFEIWIYNETGTVIAHNLQTGVVNFRNGHTAFDHKWNKFVWGGNRFAGAYCPGDDPLCDFGPIDNFYIDDVIAHWERIGEAYFLLIGGNPTAKTPKPPSDVRIQ
jgi:hypothetical protein